MNKHTFTGPVINGKIQCDRARLCLALEELEGQTVEMTICKLQFNRSDAQNRYYWVCVTLLAEHLGYHKDELHDALKRKFLTVDAPMPYSRSTASLTVEEFAEYIDRVIQVAAEMGCVILDAERYGIHGAPRPQLKMELWK